MGKTKKNFSKVNSTGSEQSNIKITNSYLIKAMKNKNYKLVRKLINLNCPVHEDFIRILYLDYQELIEQQNANNTNPHSLKKDLGNTTILASDAVGGFSTEVRQITLGSTVVLEAGVTYWVGSAIYPVTKASHTDSAGPSFLNHSQKNLGNFWNNGTHPTTFSNLGSFGMYMGAFYNAGTTWSTFDFASGTLPNNISNQIGNARNTIRIGLSLSAI
jgi:hypothetical protein